MNSVNLREGFISFRGYRTFYKIVGDINQKPAGNYPLLALHGRPPSHEVLEPLEALAEAGRPVIFYDQLGCGQSDRPEDPSIWSIDLFVDELDRVRRELNLDHIHLLGHSWGGIVGMEYVLRKPSGRYDFCTPGQAESIHSGIPNSELVIFEKSSHCSHAEETALYLEILSNFLTQVEEQVGEEA